MNIRSSVAILVACLAASVGLAPCHAAPITWQVMGWKLAQTDAVQTARVTAPGAALAEDFSKAGSDRQLLWLDGSATGSLADARTLIVRYRLALTKGTVAQLGLVLFEPDGKAWWGSIPVVASSEPGEVDFGLNGLKPAAFSAEQDAPFQAGAISRVWVGPVLDGPCQGRFEIASVKATAHAPVRTAPLPVTWGPGSWTVGKDPAVTATLTTPADGPGGKPCMRLDFAFPGDRHMYVLPSKAAPQGDLDGYDGLRLTYRAQLPDGIQGLLVTLIQTGGGQYFYDPLVPASAEWATTTLPLGHFKPAPWAKEAGEHPDMSEVTGLIIGTHGTASGAGGKGLIEVCDIAFVPTPASGP
jgi:hypothetical protein